VLQRESATEVLGPLPRLLHDTLQVPPGMREMRLYDAISRRFMCTADLCQRRRDRFTTDPIDLASPPSGDQNWREAAECARGGGLSIELS
jgi:hypothetical protein